jgi:hypothetical protein
MAMAAGGAGAARRTVPIDLPSEAALGLAPVPNRKLLLGFDDRPVFWLMDVAAPESATIRSTTEVPGIPVAVAASSDVALVLARDTFGSAAWLLRYDISDPDRPRATGRLRFDDVGPIAIEDDVAWVAEGRELWAVDLSTVWPRRLASHTLTMRPKRIRSLGDSVLVADDERSQRVALRWEPGPAPHATAPPRPPIAAPNTRPSDRGPG